MDNDKIINREGTHRESFTSAHDESHQNDSPGKTQNCYPSLFALKKDNSMRKEGRLTDAIRKIVLENSNFLTTSATATSSNTSTSPPKNDNRRDLLKRSNNFKKPASNGRAIADGTNSIKSIVPVNKRAGSKAKKIKELLEQEFNYKRHIKDLEEAYARTKDELDELLEDNATLVNENLKLTNLNERLQEQYTKMVDENEFLKQQLEEKSANFHLGEDLTDPGDFKITVESLKHKMKLKVREAEGERKRAEVLMKQYQEELEQTREFAHKCFQEKQVLSTVIKRCSSCSSSLFMNGSDANNAAVNTFRHKKDCQSNSQRQHQKLRHSCRIQTILNVVTRPSGTRSGSCSSKRESSSSKRGSYSSKRGSYSSNKRDSFRSQRGSEHASLDKTKDGVERRDSVLYTCSFFPRKAKHRVTMDPSFLASSHPHRHRRSSVFSSVSLGTDTSSDV